MSLTAANMKPMSNGSKTLNFVWAYDSNAHIVGLSGEALPSVAKMINANQANSGLTKSVDADGTIIVGQWTDALGKIYKNDVSGSDISGALFSKAFYVSSDAGSLKLTNTTAHKYTFPMGDIIDTLFTDQLKTPYLTSYRKNIPASFQNSTDLSLTIVTNNFGDVLTTNFNAGWTDSSNNKITIDCSGFIYGNDLSFNPVDVDLSLNLNTGYLLSSYAPARTNVANRIYVNMYKMGLDAITTPVKFSTNEEQQSFIDISVNVLNPLSKLVIVTDGAAVISNQTAPLQPNIDLMNILNNASSTDGTYTFTKAGRQNLRIPITIGAGVYGQWFWKISIKDGNMESTIRDFNLQIMPSFSAPVVTVTDQIQSSNTYNVNLKVADNNFNADISNNLPRGLMLIPRINAIGSNLIDVDNTASGINNAITLNWSSSSNASNPYNLVANDISKNTLYFADVSNSYINVFNTGKGLEVRSVDISNIGFGDFKLNDVSTNILFTNVSAYEHKLPSRSFNIFVDWLPNAQPIVSSIIKPQTLSIGTFNVPTSYSSNVIMTNNNNGTVTLSLSDYNGNLAGANYRVKIFTDKTCSTLANANVTLETQSNVDKSPSVYDFKVIFDSENKATFTSPLLTKNDTNSINYMVAYLENSNVYLYTASNIVPFSNFNFPTIALSFDTTTALTAANLNAIVNIDNNLDLDLALADLSGYAVKSINVGFDMSCNLSLPSWSINAPTLTFTVNDTNNVVKSFDISANRAKKSSVANTIVFDNSFNVCNNGSFFIDLSYNNSAVPCLFSMNISLSDADNTDYSKTNKTVVFYYNGNYDSNARLNVGGIKNTLIVYNDTKYIIDNKPDLTQIAFGSKDSFNCYSWLAGSATNSYALNLARSEFVGLGQTLDVSFFNVSASIVYGSDSANLYIGYSGAWTDINTGTSTVNGVLPVVSSGSSGSVVPSFARNNYSWIDTKKFVGTIDISYKTKNTNGLSVTANILRLVVVPRPNITLAISQFPNTLVNTKSITTATITNTAMNKAGTTIGLASWAPADVSGNKSLAFKLKTIMSINSGVIRLVTATGTPDVANATSFVLSSVGDLAYGKVAMPVVTFNGRSIAGLVSSKLRATYLDFASKPVLSPIVDFSVAVYSTDSTFNNSVYINNLFANNTINFAGMPFVQYVALDNSNNSLALHTDSRTKNAVYVVVENKGSVTSGNITHGGSAFTGSSLNIAAGVINVYHHTGGDFVWSHIYTKQN